MAISEKDYYNHCGSLTRGGGPMDDRRPSEGQVVYVQTISNISMRATNSDFEDLKKVFKDQFMNMVYGKSEVIITRDYHHNQCSVEVWMPNNIAMPRIQMLQSDFRPVPVPECIKKKLKSGPKKILSFYDELKEEVMGWIKN